MGTYHSPDSSVRLGLTDALGIIKRRAVLDETADPLTAFSVRAYFLLDRQLTIHVFLSPLVYTYSDAIKIEKMLRNPNSNDPSRDKPCDAEIERQVAKLSGVVAYCCNESDCRRVLLLRHFDEEFKPENCHNQCDNCHRPGTIIQHDFTAEAQQIIQLLQEMIAVNTSRGVTQGQFKDTWKGRNNKGVQQYKGLALYASGKALGHPTIERIYNNLVADGVITSYSVQSSSGYSNTYIQVTDVLFSLACKR